MHKEASFDRDQLLACGRGEMFGPGNAQLPVPNMLMMDRVVRIADHGGAYGKGEILAELDIHPELWFFDCHFPGDPVMPGCLGLDATVATGRLLSGLDRQPGPRAAPWGSARSSSPARCCPTASKVTYQIDMKRVISRKLVLGIGDGVVQVDGRTIYTAKDLRVGLFTSTEGF